ncbi:family 1 glycosylhydrolase [Streptomyces umbrinus]|uniref:family 1 glycosylhydrolase n=1 Tax=Streptomyces umbrinus TaxID=67370 RepID=UPI0033EAD4B3
MWLTWNRSAARRNGQLDNYERFAGFSKRFGIVHVAPDTLDRKPKASCQWYRDAIARRELVPRHRSVGEALGRTPAGTHHATGDADGSGRGLPG